MPTGGDSPQPWSALAVRLAVGLVLCAAIASTIPPLLDIGFRYERFYSEGWNVYHAMRAAAGEILYSGDPERLVNYPFLSFYLVGWLKPLFGDLLLIGRGLSLLGLAGTVVGGAMIVRRLGGQAVDGAFAAACVLGFQVIQASAWIGADDPQLLAEAFMVGGLVCYLGDRGSARRLAVAAILFALGGFTKHNLVAIPAAVTLDILVAQPRRFTLWCAFAAAALGLLTGLTYLIAGGDFLHELLAPRPVSLAQMKYHPQKFATTFKVPVILALIYPTGALAPPKSVLLRSYGALALATAILFAAGEGTSYNLFLDVVVWLGIIGGLALQRWRLALLAAARGGRMRALLLGFIPLVLAQPIVTRLPANAAELFTLPATLAVHATQAEQFSLAAATLRSHPGPALCESLLMCFDAGKPLLVDTFNTRQMILTGRMAESVLLGEIARHRFAVIELPTGIYLSGQSAIIAPNFFTRRASAKPHCLRSTGITGRRRMSAAALSTCRSHRICAAQARATDHASSPPAQRAALKDTPMISQKSEPRIGS